MTQSFIISDKVNNEIMYIEKNLSYKDLYCVRYCIAANWIVSLLEMEGIKCSVFYDNESFNVDTVKKIPKEVIKIIKNYFEFYGH